MIKKDDKEAIQAIEEAMNQLDADLSKGNGDLIEISRLYCLSTTLKKKPDIIIRGCEWHYQRELALKHAEEFIDILISKNKHNVTQFKQTTKKGENLIAIQTLCGDILVEYLGGPDAT